MTNVWPSARSSGVTVNDAIDLTLSGLNTNVLLYAARAQISNVTKSNPRNNQARKAASSSSQRFCFGSAIIASADVTKEVRQKVLREPAAI